MITVFKFVVFLSTYIFSEFCMQEGFLIIRKIFLSRTIKTCHYRYTIKSGFSYIYMYFIHNFIKKFRNAVYRAIPQYLYVYTVLQLLLFLTLYILNFFNILTLKLFKLYLNFNDY